MGPNTILGGGLPKSGVSGRKTTHNLKGFPNTWKARQREGSPTTLGGSLYLGSQVRKRTHPNPGGIPYIRAARYKERPNRTPGGCPLNLGCLAQRKITHNPGGSLIPGKPDTKRGPPQGRGGSLYLGIQTQRGAPTTPGNGGPKEKGVWGPKEGDMGGIPSCLRSRRGAVLPEPHGRDVGTPSPGGAGPRGNGGAQTRGWGRLRVP